MLDAIELARFGFLLFFSILYAYFDVFHKRNVPDELVYASLFVGMISTLFYQFSIIFYSFLIAVFVGAVGYLLYKVGLLGLGDGLEMVFISLMFPFQPQPLINIPQLNLPFILSVFVAAGFATIISLPIYYFAKAKRFTTNKNSILKAAIVFLSYLILVMLVYLLFGFRIIATIFILTIASFSALLFLIEGEINKMMVVWVYPDSLEENDIIATNLMNKEELTFFKTRYKKFDRLADRELIEAIKKYRKKIPVYKKAIPFSLFIFIGILIALLIGDPIFIIFW